jgi:hypothetical protein
MKGGHIPHFSEATSEVLACVLGRIANDEGNDEREHKVHFGKAAS